MYGTQSMPHIPVTMAAKIITPKLRDIKQTFIIHTDYVGQEIGQEIVRIACFCSIMSELSAK